MPLASESTSRLTCIINVRNGERYIAETLASVAAQTDSLALLVIDNHSTDKTTEIVRSFPLATLVSTPQPMTLGAARAFSLGLVKTPYVAWLDADDLWEPEFCRESVIALDTYRTAPFVSSSSLLIDSSSVLLTEQKYRAPQTAASPMPPTHYAKGENFNDMALRMRSRALWLSYVFRTDILRKVGGLNPLLTYSPDYDVILRTLSQGESVHIQRDLSRYRVHPGQESHRISPQVRLEETYSSLEQALRILGRLTPKEQKALHRQKAFRISLMRARHENSIKNTFVAALNFLRPSVQAWIWRRIFHELSYKPGQTLET